MIFEAQRVQTAGVENVGGRFQVDAATFYTSKYNYSTQMTERVRNVQLTDKLTLHGVFEMEMEQDHISIKGFTWPSGIEGEGLPELHWYRLYTVKQRG